MPTFPHLVLGLSLISCCVKPLIETCMVQLESSSFCPLSSLEDFQIGEDTEIEAMPAKWMHNLKSLKRLSLKGSSIIPPVLRQLKHVPTQLIKRLYISGVDKLDLCKDEEDVSTQSQTLLDCFRSLEEIWICDCPNMKDLSERIGDLQSLWRIYIDDCAQLQSLPEAMCDLTNLQTLNITGCPLLRSLPEAMCQLTNLQTLKIEGCPLLRERCQTEVGQDWLKIAHIPHLYII